MIEDVIGSSILILGCEAVASASAALSTAATELVAATESTLFFTNEDAVRARSVSAFEVPISGSSIASTPRRSSLRAISSFCLKVRFDFASDKVVSAILM